MGLFANKQGCGAQGKGEDNKGPLTEMPMNWPGAVLSQVAGQRGLGVSKELSQFRKLPSQAELASVLPLVLQPSPPSRY